MEVDPPNHEAADQSFPTVNDNNYNNICPILENEPQPLDENDEEYYEEEITVKERVKRFSIKHNLTYAGVSDLVRLINNLPQNIPPLPRSYVTLMDTPKGKINTKYVPPGEYFHIGLEQIAKELAKLPGTHTGTGRYNYVLHVDGISLSDSSHLEAWTISGWIPELNLEPFLLGVYVGKKSPADFDVFRRSCLRYPHRTYGGI